MEPSAWRSFAEYLAGLHTAGEGQDAYAEQVKTLVHEVMMDAGGQI
jgi:hypothetical protein